MAEGLSIGTSGGLPKNALLGNMAICNALAAACGTALGSVATAIFAVNDSK